MAESASAEAREAAAADYARQGLVVSPDRIVLTASTSEAYSLLFKVLCDPGDELLEALGPAAKEDLLALRGKRNFDWNSLIPTFLKGRLKSEEDNWIVRSFIHIYKPVLKMS